MYQITIPGEPQGKARARTVKGHTYTPDKTVNYENLIKTIFMQKYGQPVSKGQLELCIIAHYGIAKSTSKVKEQKMLEGDIRPCKKPDADNVAKVVADSLNGIAYHDDAQIVVMTIYKLYSGKPRVEVTIQEVEE